MKFILSENTKYILNEKYFLNEKYILVEDKKQIDSLTTNVKNINKKITDTQSKLKQLKSSSEKDKYIENTDIILYAKDIINKINIIPNKSPDSEQRLVNIKTKAINELKQKVNNEKIEKSKYPNIHKIVNDTPGHIIPMFPLFTEFFETLINELKHYYSDKYDKLINELSKNLKTSVDSLENCNEYCKELNKDPDNYNIDLNTEKIINDIFNSLQKDITELDKKLDSYTMSKQYNSEIENITLKLNANSANLEKTLKNILETSELDKISAEGSEEANKIKNSNAINWAKEFRDAARKDALDVKGNSNYVENTLNNYFNSVWGNYRQYWPLLRNIWPTLQKEISHFGYTGNDNPFIHFIQQSLKSNSGFRNHVRSDVSRYDAIHDGFLSGYISKQDLVNNSTENSSLIYCDDLYNHKYSDMIDYLKLKSQAEKLYIGNNSDSDSKYKKFIYAKYPKENPLSINKFITDLFFVPGEIFSKIDSPKSGDAKSKLYATDKIYKQLELIFGKETLAALNTEDEKEKDEKKISSTDIDGLIKSLDKKFKEKNLSQDTIKNVIKQINSFFAKGSMSDPKADEYIANGLITKIDPAMEDQIKQIKQYYLNNYDVDAAKASSSLVGKIIDKLSTYYSITK